MAFLNFDASTVPEQSFEPLPAGDYLVWITESDIPNDKEGNQKVAVTMEVLEPQQYANRKLWDSYTLENQQNPKWAETGRQILATLCRAIGVMSPRETEEMHEIPFHVRIEVDTWTDGSLHNKVVARWSTASQAPPLKRKKPQAQQASRPAAQAGYMPQQQPQYTQQQPQQYAPPQQRPQAPQQGGQYPGQGGQSAQTWQPPQAHPQAQPQQFQNPLYPPQHPAQQPQQYQPPAGPPAWAQQPPQPQAPGYQHPAQAPQNDELPF